MKKPGLKTKRKYDLCYKKPILTAIGLDSDQAILVQCQVGGAFINGNFCIQRGTIYGPCVAAVRGGRDTRSGYAIEGTAPS